MRLPRLTLPGLPQHIVIRGINGQTIFRSDHDHRIFLGYLTAAKEKYHCSLHTYVLMPNHIHLLVTPSCSSGVGKLVQLVARQYVQYFNQQYHRTGTLWEGRYKSALVDSASYSIDVYRYIEQNPVRNGLVKHPDDFFWSSYKHNIGKVVDKLISPCEAYLNLGDTVAKQQKNYDVLMHSPIELATLGVIRLETNRSRVFGSEKFKQKVELLLGIDLQLKPRGGDRRSMAYLQTV